MIKDGSRPDLVFFYSLNIPSTLINSFEQGNDIYQTANGILYADKEETIPIGRFAFSIIVFEGLLNFSDRKLYEASGTNVYYLPEGTITHNINGVFEKTNSDKFIVPSLTTNVFEIVSGTQDFLRQPGIVVQVIIENGEREMLVYFDK